MSLMQALGEAMKDAPECVATGWVERTTGMFLVIKTVGRQPQELLIHVFAHGDNTEDQVRVVVTRVTANPDLVFTRTCAALSAVEIVG